MAIEINHRMEDTRPLIQQIRESYELTEIKQKPLREYYTCVRYQNIPLSVGFDQTYYGPGQWSCMKGWFEGYDNTFKNKRIDHKVLDYCKFRNTIDALNYELGDKFVLYVPRPWSFVPRKN